MGKIKYISLVFLTLFVGCGKFYQDPRIQVAGLHNKIREQHHLQVFENDYDLASAAQKHAQWMADHHTMSHEENDPKTRTISERITMDRFHAIGENVAYGQRDPEEVMNDWMHSHGHRRNILNENFDHIGVGVAYDDNGTVYWCVTFGGLVWFFGTRKKC